MIKKNRYVKIKQLINDDDQFSEYDFYSKIRLSNNTFKTTESGRLSDLNAKIITYLSNNKTYRILDVGASSATTSVEFAEDLDKENIDYIIYATDKTMYGRLVATKCFSFLFEMMGKHNKPHL